MLGLLNTAQMAAAAPWTVGYPLAMVPLKLMRAVQSRVFVVTKHQLQPALEEKARILQVMLDVQLPD